MIPSKKTPSLTHLKDVNDLLLPQIRQILSRAKYFYEQQFNIDRCTSPLFQKTVMLLFFENSTRTMASFEVAAKKLGADVINIPVEKSSISKGESFLDTVLTLNAMLPDILIMRHHDSAVMDLVSQNINYPLLNAGDGTRAHPTQALLDALTIQLHKEDFKTLVITICGDILHSRVARSNIKLLKMLGATVRIMAPPEFLPNDIKDIEQFTDMAAGLKDTDVVMMLRVQKERGNTPLPANYAKNYGLNYEKLAYAKDDVIVMHPGPLNRGLEIDSTLADDPKYSVIQQQVTVGVAVRMAVLEFLQQQHDKTLTL